ncbi:30S ribosomal protein S21 [Prochlorococcus sp. MIT 1307]|uniref:30S ribosomal protein S21 n=1 Tax=Prochlorococcus sp. MIT 1307 TaxID=3096219 RepID=UPI002A7528FC|nr:30S ribosomal protein S21 [Prochlorococcus sp. MIT 1307]
MTKLTIGGNEAVESAISRFKREVVKVGIFNELRRIRHHETPVEKYKRKQGLRNKSRRHGHSR